MPMTVLEEKILRSLYGGGSTIAAVRLATNTHPWPKTKLVLLSLVERGFIKRGRGTLLTLTPMGRAPFTPVAAPPMKPYVPPAPAFRRSGTDEWKRFRSLSTEADDRG